MRTTKATVSCNAYAAFELTEWTNLTEDQRATLKQNEILCVEDDSEVVYIHFAKEHKDEIEYVPFLNGTHHNSQEQQLLSVLNHAAHLLADEIKKAIPSFHHMEVGRDEEPTVTVL